MLTAGITFMKLGVIPLYSPRGPSFLRIVLNNVTMLSDGPYVTENKDKKMTLFIRTEQKEVKLDISHE